MTLILFNYNRVTSSIQRFIIPSCCTIVICYLYIKHLSNVCIQLVYLLFYMEMAMFAQLTQGSYENVTLKTALPCSHQARTITNSKTSSLSSYDTFYRSQRRRLTFPPEELRKETSERHAKTSRTATLSRSTAICNTVTIQARNLQEFTSKTYKNS